MGSLAWRLGVLGLGLGLGAGCSKSSSTSVDRFADATQRGLLGSEVEGSKSVLDSLYALARPVNEEFLARRGVSENGQLVPTHAPPAPALLSMHAVAGYEVVTVYADPDLKSEKLGFLRLGTRLRVTPAQSYRGCSRGWFQLPSGGFACASKGLLVEASPPYLSFSPPQIRNARFPYTWARVQRAETPMWRSLPSEEEREAALRLAASKKQAVPGSDPTKDSSPASGPLLSAQGPAPDLPLWPAMPWLSAGHFLSLDRPFYHQDQRYWRSATGAYVQADALADHQPQDFRGQKIAEGTNLDQLAFVALGAGSSRRLAADGSWSPGPRVDAQQAVRVLQKANFEGEQWSRIQGDLWLPSKDLISAQRAKRPETVAKDEPWIDVDLSRQTLVAYEGDRPVYFTLISSGRVQKSGGNTETPTGAWRIYSKQRSSNMSGPKRDGSPYFIQDVPWVMYYSGNYAIHGAFWHRGFGQPRSQGCINLGPSDARWLFSWTRPHLPNAWHGVAQSSLNPGTLISVRASSSVPTRG